MVSRGSIVVAKNRHSISRVLLCPPVAEIKLLRMNTLLCILLAFMVPVAAAQILFQAGTGEEEIKGKPKQVRLGAPGNPRRKGRHDCRKGATCRSNRVSDRCQGVRNIERTDPIGTVSTRRGVRV